MRPSEQQSRRAFAIATTFDLIILIYTSVALSVVMFGGFEIGGITATTVAKPLLIVMLLFAVRMTIDVHTAFSVRLNGMLERIRGLRFARIPAAVRDTVGVLLVTRVALFLIAFVANALLLPARERPFAAPGPWPKFSETFAVWDAGWYWDIAVRGYYFQPDAQSSIAFFPLYPFLVRACAALFGGTPEITFWTGLALSWIAIAGGLMLLHRYTEQVTGDQAIARRTILYVAVFPFSFYFSRFYTESLFLFLTVAAIYAAFRERWWWAGLAGALAAITRPNGILIALPLVLLACSSRSLPPLRWRLLALLPVPLALLGFCMYVYALTGDPWAWLTAQQQWGYSIDRLPHRHLLRSFSSIEQDGLYAALLRSKNAPIEFLYSLLALVFIMTVPSIWRRFGPALALYVLVSLAIPLSGSTLEGIGRYASVLFPVFMLAATIQSARLQETIVIVSCLLLTLCLVLFVGWHPLQ